MLVRFNKGPWHRRLQEVNASDIRNGVISVAVYGKDMSHRSFNPNSTTTTTVAPGYGIAVYRLKMVKINLRGTDEMIPSVFPDGAVCFEFEGKY